MHPTATPEESSKHGSVCIGEGEPVWLEILEDAKNKKLKKFYQAAEPMDITKYPRPDRSLFENKKGYDWKPFLIQVLRGCEYTCQYCIIPEAHGRKFRYRLLDDIFDEMKEFEKYEELFIADDVLLLPDPTIEKFAVDFFDGLKGNKKDVFLNASLLLNTNPTLLKKVKDAGIDTLYCVMGFDPVSIKALTFGKTKKAAEIIKRYQDAGITLFASIGIGSDMDRPDIFDKILNFLEETNITLAEFYIHTPYPGTPSWKTLNKRNRIITKDFDYYNGTHVVYKPKRMTVPELEKGFLYLWKEFYTRHPLSPETAAAHYNMTEDFFKRHGIKI